MAWRVGYPGKFAGFDDMHEEMGKILREMREAQSPERATNLGTLSIRLLGRFKFHCREEERAMDNLNYPGREVHKKHHQCTADAIETIISLLDAMTMQDRRQAIVAHIENRLSEEVLVDHAFVDFIVNTGSAG